MNLSFLTSVSLVDYLVVYILLICLLNKMLLFCYEALRAAATVVKVENARRLDHIATLRKRRREDGEQINARRHFGNVHTFRIYDFQ